MDIQNAYCEISRRLSEEALLEQLIEESSEVIQASAKRLRILRGENPTPKTRQDNFEDLTEELADLTISMNALNWKIDIDRSHFEKLKEYKLERWEKRLNDREKYLETAEGLLQKGMVQTD